MNKNQKKRNAAHRAAMSGKSNNVISMYIQGVGKDNIWIIEDKDRKYKTCEYETAFESSKDVPEFLINLYRSFMLEKREEAVGEAYIVIDQRTNYGTVKFRTKELRKRFERYLSEEIIGMNYEDFLAMV